MDIGTALNIWLAYFGFIDVDIPEDIIIEFAEKMWEEEI